MIHTVINNSKENVLIATVKEMAINLEKRKIHLYQEYTSFKIYVLDTVLFPGSFACIKYLIKYRNEYKNKVTQEQINYSISWFCLHHASEKSNNQKFLCVPLTNNWFDAVVVVKW